MVVRSVRVSVQIILSLLTSRDNDFFCRESKITEFQYDIGFGGIALTHSACFLGTQIAPRDPAYLTPALPAFVIFPKLCGGQFPEPIRWELYVKRSAAKVCDTRLRTVARLLICNHPCVHDLSLTCSLIPETFLLYGQLRCPDHLR